MDLKRKAASIGPATGDVEEGQGGGEDAEGKLTRVTKTKQGSGVKQMRDDGGQRHRADVWLHMGRGRGRGSVEVVEAEREKDGGDRERGSRHEGGRRNRRESVCGAGRERDDGEEERGSGRGGGGRRMRCQAKKTEAASGLVETGKQGARRRPGRIPASRLLTEVGPT
jgi:hypothetical protein